MSHFHCTIWLCPPLAALQACRHFNDSGVCKENCPPPTIYDTVTFQTKPNPDKKFSFGATCIKTCPCKILRKLLLLPPTPPQCWATLLSFWNFIDLKIRYQFSFLSHFLEKKKSCICSLQTTTWPWMWLVCAVALKPTRKSSSASPMAMRRRSVRSVKEIVPKVGDWVVFLACLYTFSAAPLSHHTVNSY